MILEEFCEVERGDDSDRLSVGELFVCTFVDSLEQRHGVVDEDIDVSALRDDQGGEAFKHGFVGEIPHKPRPLLNVDHVNMSSLTLETFGTAFADPLSTASYDHGFIIKCHFLVLLQIQFNSIGSFAHYSFCFGVNISSCTGFFKCDLSFESVFSCRF